MTTTENGPTRDSMKDMMQLVDYDETFHDEVGYYLKQSDIARKGFDYHVTSIMGPQSSGKSTLLNLLFGTQFNTMQEQRGRYQVTQGVWIGKDDRDEIVILDLEGTDSRERGEDAVTFERKSALFALALSEVLIVNLWMNDVGRYNAANMSLLRTVLELDLQLFFGGEQSGKRGTQTDEGNDEERFYKTKLLFVVRDYVETTPFDELCKVLRSDVDTIWNSIDKPEAAKNTTVDQYFDLDFFAMPHKVHAKDQFYECGEELKKKFYSGSLFKPEYSRMVAADAFATYAESLWSTIRDNKELDIPSQKEMVATVRCEQIAKEVLDEFFPILNEMSQAMRMKDGEANNVVPTLFQNLSSAVRRTLQEYDTRTHRYSKSMALEKRSDLCSTMVDKSHTLVTAQLNLITSLTLQALKRKIDRHCSNDSPWRNFKSAAEEWKNEALESFEEQCGSNPKEPEESRNDVEEEMTFSKTFTVAKEKLKKEVTKVIEETRFDILARGKMECRKSFREAVEAPIDKALDNASAEQVWKQVANSNELAWDRIRKQLAEITGTDGVDLSNADRCGRYILEVREECYGEALSCIKSLIGRENAFALRVMKRFNDKFRFDERGVPRTFTPDEDIVTLFMNCKDDMLAMVDAWGTIEGGLGLFEKRENIVLFGQAERSKIKDEVSRQAGAIFMEAKRSQEASKVSSRIPLWLIGLLLVLGFDEMIMVLRNPLFLLLAIILVPILYVVFTPQAQAYVVPVVTNATRPALVKVRQVLDEYLPAAPDSTGVAGSNVTTSIGSASAPASSLSSMSYTPKEEESSDTAR